MSKQPETEKIGHWPQKPKPPIKLPPGTIVDTWPVKVTPKAAEAFKRLIPALERWFPKLKK